jgi:hypothetical protein
MKAGSASPGNGRARRLRFVRTPSKKGVEVSCTAAITEQGQWMRLFPIPYRFLDEKEQFSKYQWVEVTVRKAKDARAESYNLVPGVPIKILSPALPTKNNWESRWKIL